MIRLCMSLSVFGFPRVPLRVGGHVFFSRVWDGRHRGGPRISIKCRFLHTSCPVAPLGYPLGSVGMCFSKSMGWQAQGGNPRISIKCWLLHISCSLVFQECPLESAGTCCIKRFGGSSQGYPSGWLASGFPRVWGKRQRRTLPSTALRIHKGHMV